LDDYQSLFDPSRYDANEPVEVRAYRGPRRASVFREHLVPEDLFSRALMLARAYELHQLSALDPYGPFELNKEQARRISEEAAWLAALVNDPLLEPHLHGVRKAADFCWQYSGEAGLIIEGP
jgi:hypothetical protein